MTKKKQWIKKKQRLFGYEKLSHIITEVTKPIIDESRLLEMKIASEWKSITGDEISSYSFPYKTVFRKGEHTNGTLYVNVYGARSLEIQHNEPLIIEKIAIYFGYRVIGKLKIRQIPFADQGGKI